MKTFKMLAKFSFCFIIFHNCSSPEKALRKELNSSFYHNHYIGVMVYNPQTKDTLFSYNSEKYFTPASNTKIITLYTALNTLPERIPAFHFKIEADTIVLKGLGDPTFLHPYFKDSTAFYVAQEFDHIKIVSDNFYDTKLGPGWAWEDFDSYFNVERSAFPMYGNVVSIMRKNGVEIRPSIFDDFISTSETKNGREFFKNEFYTKSKDTSALEIPMIVDSTLLLDLWKNLLPEKKVSLVKDKKLNFIMTANSVVSDSVYKRMMLESDNFLAEQILLASAASKFDTLNGQKIRTSILENDLTDLKNKPRWVDGSGLSRYNLFTPDSFVYILNRLYQELSRERLMNLFPVGGISGTLKSRYIGNKKPYVYAKSGTVGNNYSLSGYLITKTGETLIFSIMNNHYLKPTSEIRAEVEGLLEYLRDHY